MTKKIITVKVRIHPVDHPELYELINSYEAEERLRCKVLRQLATQGALMQRGGGVAPTPPISDTVLQSTNGDNVGQTNAVNWGDSNSDALFGHFEAEK
jgi:hypothetical protein